jgi:hypothetical protein
MTIHGLISMSGTMAQMNMVFRAFLAVGVHPMEAFLLISENMDTGGLQQRNRRLGPGVTN